MIAPKNWASFQHYKDRAPSWIKLHKGLLDDFAFNRLPVESRALAPLLWLLASEYDDGIITASFEEIGYRLRMDGDELRAALRPLIGAGFFVEASTLLAQREPPASPEKETEKEKNRTDSVRGSGFEAFWKAYPRRDGPNPRKPAEQKFNALVKSGIAAEVMIEAAGRLATDEAARGNIGTRFIPQALTFLAQQRWADHAAVDAEAAREAAVRAAAKVHVRIDTPQWRAWAKHLGRTPMQDRNFGWYFDSEWPPGGGGIETAPDPPRPLATQAAASVETGSPRP